MIVPEVNANMNIKKQKKSVLKLLDLYDEFPFHSHPLWRGIIQGDLTKEQVVLAEKQHFLRTQAGQALRKDAVNKSLEVSGLMWEAIVETYLEECTREDGTPTHLELIVRLLNEGGVDESELTTVQCMPANIAAIALYKHISDRGPGCHIIGAGMVEYYYSQLSPKIFDSYTKKYGFSEYAAETYSIHGTMDQLHAQRAFDIVDEAIKIYGHDLIEMSVRDAFVATSLHYDGMLQGATKEMNFWNGKLKN